VARLRRRAKRIVAGGEAAPAPQSMLTHPWLPPAKRGRFSCAGQRGSSSGLFAGHDAKLRSPNDNPLRSLRWSGKFRPDETHLYYWFKTELEAVRHSRDPNNWGHASHIFRVDLGDMDDDKILSLMDETNDQHTDIKVIHDRKA